MTTFLYKIGSFLISLVLLPIILVYWLWMGISGKVLEEIQMNMIKSDDNANKNIDNT